MDIFLFISVSIYEDSCLYKYIYIYIYKYTYIYFIYMCGKKCKQTAAAAVAKINTIKKFP